MLATFNTLTATTSTLDHCTRVIVTKYVMSPMTSEHTVMVMLLRRRHRMHLAPLQQDARHNNLLALLPTMLLLQREHVMPVVYGLQQQQQHLQHTNQHQHQQHQTTTVHTTTVHTGEDLKIRSHTYCWRSLHAFNDFHVHSLLFTVNLFNCTSGIF